LLRVVQSKMLSVTQGNIGETFKSLLIETDMQSTFSS
jgi:hypothetical protein